MDKRYFVFAGEDYYPKRGMDDLRGIFENLDDAKELFEQINEANDWACIWDLETEKYVGE